MFELIVRSLPHLTRVIVVLTAGLLLLGWAFGYERVDKWISNLTSRESQPPPPPLVKDPGLVQRLADAERGVERLEADARQSAERVEQAKRSVAEKSAWMDANAADQQHADGADAKRLRAAFTTLAEEFDAATVAAVEAETEGQRKATELARVRTLLTRARDAVAAHDAGAGTAVDQLCRALGR